MAIIYRLVRDGRKASSYKGKWFARAVNLGTVETDEIARIIERNCSVKRSDVLAVLTELGEVIRDQIRNSHRVRLVGIGSLMAGLHGKPCDDPQHYSNDLITDIHLCFKPDKELRLDDSETTQLPP